LNINQILIKYWGHTAFRPLQEDIINSVVEGKDTLALLPTGGGKSICFQVPALAMDGICIVISPLIALMKDQVENLLKAGIPAAALFSGMYHREVDTTLDNCIYGKTKLLYLSPERLASELVQTRLQKMKVNLIAVDEAHCISQWGYDFRPSYLNIAEIRKLLPKAPILALTATATAEVVIDIQDKLEFKEQNVFKKSFERKNLSYVVLHEDDKEKRLLKIIAAVPGSGIVYVRNRKRTKEIAEFLNRNNISASYYHAGLNHELRDERQRAWTSNKTRIIVATNAFGMGIDKPNVRFVVHLELTDSLEAYFQEAGRAGRDEKKAYAVILFNKSDEIKSEEFLISNFPSIKEIRNTYQCLANHFQLAIGAGEGTCFDFNIHEFCNKYELNLLTVFNSIKFLDKDGYMTTTEALFMPSKIHFIVGKEDLYNFQVENKAIDPFIKLLLRSYSGTFDEYVKISERDLAKRLNISKEEVIKLLNTLQNKKIIKYLAQNNVPQIVYARPRIDTANLTISKQNYEQRKERAVDKMKAVLNYAKSANKCRSQLLLSYFGEEADYRCGTCDVCLDRNKLELSELEFDEVLNKIKPLLEKEPASLQDLVDTLTDTSEDKAIKVIQWLTDNGKIKPIEDDKLKWVN